MNLIWYTQYWYSTTKVMLVHTYNGHKYMSVEGNYAAKIKLIIQNESNLSKLSPCAWPYIWRFRLFNFLKCKFFSNILASFPSCKIEKLSFFPISLKKNPINIWKFNIISTAKAWKEKVISKKVMFEHRNQGSI